MQTKDKKQLDKLEVTGSSPVTPIAKSGPQAVGQASGPERGANARGFSLKPSERQQILAGQYPDLVRTEKDFEEGEK